LPAKDAKSSKAKKQKEPAFDPSLYLPKRETRTAGA
jgi:hypothetical protein